MILMYFSHKEFKRYALKVLILGIIIGASFGLAAGFLWGSISYEDIVRITVTSLPRQTRAIPF
jgi:hypothetical protein